MIISWAEIYRLATEHDGDKERFIAHAATWLDRERWADHQQEPETPRLRAGMA